MASNKLKYSSEKIRYIESVEKRIQLYEIRAHSLSKQKDMVLDNFCRLSLVVYCALLIIFLSVTMSWTNWLVSLSTMIFLPFSMSCSHCAIKWWYEEKLESFYVKLYELYYQKDEIFNNILNDSMKSESDKARNLTSGVSFAENNVVINGTSKVSCLENCGNKNMRTRRSPSEIYRANRIKSENNVNNIKVGKSSLDKHKGKHLQSGVSFMENNKARGIASGLSCLECPCTKSRTSGISFLENNQCKHKNAGISHLKEDKPTRLEPRISSLENYKAKLLKSRISCSVDDKPKNAVLGMSSLPSNSKAKHKPSEVCRVENNLFIDDFKSKKATNRSRSLHQISDQIIAQNIK